MALHSEALDEVFIVSMTKENAVFVTKCGELSTLPKREPHGMRGDAIPINNAEPRGSVCDKVSKHVSCASRHMTVRKCFYTLETWSW